MESIDIGIPCTNNTEKYVRFLIDNINSTKSSKLDIKIFIGVNSKNIDLEFLENIKKQFKNIEIIVNKKIKNKPPSSLNHGECINMILENFKSRYGMILDADVAFLLKGWDIKLTSFIKNDTVIIGSEYGLDDSKYMKNPNVITCLFDNEIIKKIGINFLPGNKKLVINNENSKIYERQIGDKIFLDTGSEIPEKLHKFNYKSKYLQLFSHRINSTKKSIKFLDENIKGEEFHLEGEPIFTHLGRSSIRDFDKNIDCINWRNAIKKWLEKI